MTKLNRRAFMGASIATIASSMLPPGRAYAQALPAYVLPGGISSSGVVSAGTSLQYNGASVALRSGERAVISRVAQQVAASGVTRAVANRTMSAVATRLLVGAAAASPWGLAAVGLGAVAYGAYRYLTADDEAANGVGTSSTSYSILFDANGASVMRAAAANGCAGMPSNQGGKYPSNVVLGPYNGSLSSTGCVPGFRQKVVVVCRDVDLPALAPTPSGWNKDYTYNAGQKERDANGNVLFEYWVFFTRNFPATGDTSGGAQYNPVTAPTIPDPAQVPQALPDSVKNKTISKQSLADLANGLWKGTPIPETDPAVLPWSPSRTVPAQAPQPVPLPYSPPVTPLAPPEAPPLKEVTDPKTPLVPPGQEVQFEYPPEIKFPGDVATDPGTNPTPTPTPTPGTSPTPTPSTGGGTDWGTPPSGDMPGVPEVFSWMPTPWTAPDLPGVCSPVPYDFSSVLKNTAGSINPCPVLNQARPVVRPVAVLGWTYFAIAQFLDL